MKCVLLLSPHSHPVIKQKKSTQTKPSWSQIKALTCSVHAESDGHITFDLTLITSQYMLQTIVYLHHKHSRPPSSCYVCLVWKPAPCWQSRFADVWQLYVDSDKLSVSLLLSMVCIFVFHKRVCLCQEHENDVLVSQKGLSISFIKFTYNQLISLSITPEWQ